jgi:hypothetical protein
MMTAGNIKDPLELARRELDFAAIAASAPSSKEILFKAQTMVPLSPPRPWKRIGATAAAVVLAAVLIAAPWVPQRSGMALLRVSFEQPFSRSQAQDVISHCLRELPGHALLGAEYDATSTGHLALRVSSLKHSSGQLHDAVDDVISAYPTTLQPYQVQTRHVSLERTASPTTMAWRLFSGSGSEGKPGTGDPIATDVVANKAVLATGISSQLRRAGYELKHLDFILPGTDAKHDYSFTVDCWPYPVGVTISQYDDLSASAQQELRRRVEDFLSTANLRETSLVLAEQPGSEYPLLVDVQWASGQHDQRLTANVQAWIEQPTAEELTSIGFEPQDPLLKALENVLPGYEHRIEYKRMEAAGSAVPMYKITVVITGRKATPARDVSALSSRTSPGDEDIEY